MIEKKWGHEIVIANKPEYAGKVLVFKKNYQSSLHYHKMKVETFYLHTGLMIAELVTPGAVNVKLFEAGQTLQIGRGTKHRLYALEPSTVFEVSTQHQEEDVYREKDQLSGKSNVAEIDMLIDKYGLAIKETK